jgi:GAF domain-containing protein
MSMFAWLKRILAAPVFEDEDKTRTARLLNTLALVAVILLLVAGLYHPLSHEGGIEILPNVIRIGVTILIVVFTLLANQQSRENERALTESNRELEHTRLFLERRVADRTQGLQVASQVSRAITSVLELDELLTRVVDLVRERFELYYVGVFLVEQDQAAGSGATGEGEQWAVLRAGTGEAGRQMLALGHKLQVGGESMIGQCVARNEARIALDVGQEVQRFDNPWLPETRSEMALSLQSRGQVIGAMTVQSAAEQAFDEQDIAVLQTVADQLAVAIRNAQLFAEMQATLARSEAIVRQYVQESWDRFVETGQEVVGYRYALGQGMPSADAWLPAMEEAVRARQLRIVKDQDTQLSLALPLSSGGEVIGAIGIRRPAGEQLSEDEIALAQSIGQQVAQAVERMRLLDETLRSARRESLLRLTSEKVRSQAGLDNVICVAAQELERVMGAAHVSIRLDTGSESGASSSLIGERATQEAERDIIGPAMEYQEPATEPGKRGGAVTVPLQVRGGQIIGLVELVRDSVAGDWTVAERSLLESLAEEIAEAIVAERLSEQTQASLQETERLYEASRRISEAESDAQILDVVLSTVAGTAADRAAVWMFGQPVTTGLPTEQRLGAFWDRSGAHAPESWDTRAVDERSLVRILSRTEPMLISDVRLDERLDEADRDWFERLGARSVAVVPLAVASEWLGYVTAMLGVPHTWTDDELRVYEAVGDQAATALQSLRLLRDAESRARRERIIREITTKISNTVELDAILNTAVRELGQALGVSRAFVRLSTGSGDSALPDVEDGQEKG